MQCNVYTCFCDKSEYGAPAESSRPLALSVAPRPWEAAWSLERLETGQWREASVCQLTSPYTGHGHNKWTGAMAAQNWVMIISEQHRYQGVSYKSDIIVISGDLDTGHKETLQCASVHLQGWMLGTDRPWSSSMPGASRPASWTARTGGSC